MNTEFFFGFFFLPSFRRQVATSRQPNRRRPIGWTRLFVVVCRSFFLFFLSVCGSFFVFFFLSTLFFFFSYSTRLFIACSLLSLNPPTPSRCPNFFFVIFSRFFFFNRALPSFFTEFYFSRLVRDSGRISPINLLLRQYWLKLVYLDWLWYHQDSVSIRGLSHLPSFFFYRVLFFSSSAWLWTNFTSQLIHMKILIQIGLLNFTLKPVPVSIRGLSHVPSFYLYRVFFVGSVAWEGSKTNFHPFQWCSIVSASAKWRLPSFACRNIQKKKSLVQ